VEYKNTLVIYDATGYIIQQMSGSVREPVGIPFLWIEVPEGKIVQSVDVSATPHVPVFVDLPETPEEKMLKLEQQLADTNSLLLEFMESILV